MHELAITQSVVDLVLARTGGRQVVAVRVRVGALSGFVPESMELCFELAVVGTAAEGARLVVEQTPGRICCRSCGTVQPVPDRILLCACGSADVEVVAGDELSVVSVELAREPSCA